MGRNTSGGCLRHEIVMVNAMERGQSTSDPGMPAPGDPSSRLRDIACRIGRDSVCNRRHFMTVVGCLQFADNVIASHAWGRGIEINFAGQKTTFWEILVRNIPLPDLGGWGKMQQRTPGLRGVASASRCYITTAWMAHLRRSTTRPLNAPPPHSVSCQRENKAQIFLPKIAQSRCLGSGAGGSATRGGQFC